MMTPEERWHAYRECFSSPAGQQVLRDLRFNFGHEDRSTIDPECPYKTYAAEGQRTVTVFIRRRLEEPMPISEDGVGEAQLEPQSAHEKDLHDDGW